MNYWIWLSGVAIVIGILTTASLTYSSPVEDPEVGEQPNIRALLSNLRNGGLFAPPTVHMNKLAPYLQKAPSKRNGYWIWMPAQGYVSVPNEEYTGSASKGSSSGNLLRYG